MSERRAYTDLVDLFTRSSEAFKERPLFGIRIDDRWQWTNYGDFAERVDHVRGGLAQLGIGRGDTVAMISGNRLEWALVAYAAYGLGARFCPMYETQLPKDWEYIVEDSEAKILVASTYEIYEAVEPWAGQLGKLEKVFSLSLPEEDEASLLWVEAQGRQHPADTVAVDTDTICGFIYTSGTTGKPKGVLLSHGNITSNINSVSEFYPINMHDRSLCFLPWAHSFGQTCELHMLISRGASMALVDVVERLMEYAGEVRPTVLYSVPRVFNRIYDGLNKRMAEEGGLKKKLFDAAMANEAVRERLAEAGRSSLIADIKHAVLDRLIFSKVRDRLGGRLRFAISGGAALSKEVGTFIRRLGIIVCEGYGLTETSPIVSSNYPGAIKLGSVGLPIPGVEVIIDTSVVEDDEEDVGEIVVKGPNVMQGYHNLPEETAKVIMADGAFRTGDLGRLDSDGYLHITGRIKEQYKLENGKYVVPAPLEELLQLSPFISQAYIYGSNKPFNVALLVPDRLAVEGWAKKQGIGGDWDELLETSQVRQLFEKELAEHADAFKRFEQPRKFALLGEEFSIENGMLTPKMSLKRRVVTSHYQDMLDGLYSGD